MIRITLYLLCVSLVAGCAGNPFKDYYRQTSSYQQITGKALDGQSDPAIMKRSNPKEDSLSLVHSGHLPLGYSKFVSSKASAAQAKAFGAELGADLVVLYSDYRNTESKNADIPMPSTTTFMSMGSSDLVTAYGTDNQAFSYSVDKHEFMAGYWVKAKPKKWGLFTRDINPSEFARLKTNRGVFVRVTVKGTPSHKAGIMRGDVLLQVGSEKVFDQSSLETIFRAHTESRIVDFQILRDGKEKTFTLREPG